MSLLAFRMERGDAFQRCLCLAPMIRASTTPLRLLATEYGADLVWSEEIIASKIAACSRRVSPHTGTVQFVTAGGHAVFETIPTRERVVFQLGTACPTEAVQAAQVVGRDVMAVDINMGCNKHSAVSCGMGAALGRNPEEAAGIVKALVRNLPSDCPVTAKVRLQDNPQRTLDLARALEVAGASAITVHCRRSAQVNARNQRTLYRGDSPLTLPDQGPGDAAEWRALAPIVQAVRVPVIGNGDVFDVPSALAMMRAARGAGRQLGGIMLARGALRDCSVFRRLAAARLWEEGEGREEDVGGCVGCGRDGDGIFPGGCRPDAESDAGRSLRDCGRWRVQEECLREVIERYAELSLDTHMHPKNTKFVIQAMLHEVGVHWLGPLYVCIQVFSLPLPPVSSSLPLSPSLSARALACMLACVNVGIHVFMYLRMHVFVSMHAHGCMYVIVCVFVCVCTCACTHERCVCMHMLTS